MRIWLAECIGTFALVFAGIAALAAGLDTVGVALAFGVAVAVMIAAVGPISYAHFNPAVTVGFWVTKRISLKQLLLYWSAEIAGALLAIMLLHWLYRERLEAVNYGATSLAPNLSVWAGFGIEVVLTFFLMFVIYSCVIQKQALAGIYIGLTVTLGALAGGTLTGASMNPARTLAPAVLSGIWSQHWLYWLAPMVGAVLGALAADYIWLDERQLTTATLSKDEA